MIQKTITRKSDLRPIVGRLEEAYDHGDLSDFWAALETEILQHRVKFPLLEFVGKEIASFMPYQRLLDTADAIAAKGYEGGYVVAAIILQSQLDEDAPLMFQKACDIIMEGNEWYVCDIVGERVYGHGLLVGFESNWPLIRPYLDHPSTWMQRSVGVAAHYATKKGLPAEKVAILFEALMPLARRTDLHVKKGVGWAFKTIARFHSDMVLARWEEIEADPSVNSWCKEKIRTGLATAR